MPRRSRLRSMEDADLAVQDAGGIDQAAKTTGLPVVP
jgi:hypothetical protein